MRGQIGNGKTEIVGDTKEGGQENRKPGEIETARDKKEENIEK